MSNSVTEDMAEWWAELSARPQPPVPLRESPVTRSEVFTFSSSERARQFVEQRIAEEVSSNSNGAPVQ